jgi:LysM repeat protein
MTDGVRQFQINGKQVEFQKQKKTVKRDSYANDTALSSIFDKLNRADQSGNIDNQLDEEELQEFQQKLIDAAGEDGNLSKEEAQTLLDSMGLKDIDTNTFFGFIQSMFFKDDAQEIVSDSVEEPEQADSEEEQITKGIIVQNGESPAAIAKKFGVPLQDLLEANKDALKGKGNNKYFLVGQEIVIPRKIEDEELATLTAGRKSAEGTTGDYAQQAAIRQQRAAEARERRAQEEAALKKFGMTERATGEVKAHYSKTPNKTITFKKVANAKNGRSICVDKNGNYVVVAQDGTILKTDYVKNPEKYEQARKYNENVKTRNGAESLAQQFYQIADDNSGMTSMKKMQQLLDTKVNSKNIVAFLDAYDREKTKQGDSSIIDTVTSEIGAGGTQAQRKVLMTIMDKLCQAAKEAGVSAGDIQKARTDFEKSLNKEFNAVLRRTNPKDMEKAVDFLRGAIASKQNGGGEISDKDAIAQFNETFGAENASAQKDYKEARENEGWTAKVGDTVCGWFGCNTIADMDKKLGTNAAAVKKLANSKTEAEFKKNYKEVFGIEFDKNKIAARQTAIDKYNLALNCDSTIKLTNKVMKFSGSYSDLKIALKNNFKYDDATINQIIDSYAIQAGKNKPTDDEKRELLVKFLQDTKSSASQNLRTATNGKTIEQMGKDIDLITRSAFGTNDIVKDVIQFNENQQTTEMVTEAAFEITGTVALQFVPGLGQAAAARLAVSAARWGTKAVKVVNYATKAEKAFATVNKFQKGEAIANATTRTAKVVNRGVQIGSQMVNTGVATAAVDLSDGKSVKETTKKALMNMSFAGVGASSSILAPKLMQAFGIADKALATEIAEEIINAAGSYGVTKLEGGEYGSTDAFVDFASGLIISRISHVKGGDKPEAPKTQGTKTPATSKVDTPTTPDVPKTDTPTPAPKTKPEVKPTETPDAVIKPNDDVTPEQVVTPKKDVISDEVPPTTIKTRDEVSTPEIETPVASQTGSEQISSSEIYKPEVETHNNSKINIDDNTDIQSQAKKVLNESDILSKSPDELLAMLNNDFCTSSEILGKNHITFEKDNIGYTFVYDSNNNLVAFKIDLLDGQSPKFYELHQNKVSEIDFIQYDQVRDFAFEEITNSKVSSINTKLEKRPNIKEIIEEFRDEDVTHWIKVGHGRIQYDLGKTFYEVMFDKTGNVLGYYRLSGFEGEYVLYNSKGKPEKVTPKKYRKEYDSHVGKYEQAMDTSVADELLGLKSTQIDIETLLKNNGTDIPIFNSFTINELNSLVRNADDSRILNALLIDKKFKMPIDSQLKISSVREYTYNCDDIINILRSDKAKAFILDKINSGASFSKSDLKKLDKDLFFDPSSYELETKRDLSHTIEDLQLTDNNGNPIDDRTLNYFFEQNSNFRQKIPSGEVANINGHMYVNDGGHLTKLELSKETFEKLFPIGTRHKIEQGALGDCWLVTSMGALMDSPKGRASIYKMFSQEGKDILVKFPNQEGIIRFKNGKLNNLAPRSIYMDGFKPKMGVGNSHVKASKGLRMLEQAYSILRNDGFENTNIKDKAIQDIFFMNKQMQCLSGGIASDAIINIVGEDHVIIRNASDEKEYMRLVDKCIDDPNKIVTFSTKNKVNNLDYDLVNNHAYHIVAFDREKGVIDISNPWHNNEIRQIPVRDWLNYIVEVSVMEIV